MTFFRIKFYLLIYNNIYIINMLKKLTITIIYICLLAFNANAGSDGELALKKDQPQRNKRLF